MREYKLTRVSRLNKHANNEANLFSKFLCINYILNQLESAIKYFGACNILGKATAVHRKWIKVVARLN